ncbi:MAG: YqzL family protein [Turicibacter sp.]|nr:YqzL family protein [Turicibacter sp.]
MDSFEWEVFKRTGTIRNYLIMKQREYESQASLDEEFAMEEEFDIEKEAND